MSNYVKIATIGPGPVEADRDANPQEVVGMLINFWRGRFEQVLPDRPDLIVVPEACDRPWNCSTEKLSEYYKVRGNQVWDFFATIAAENNCYVVYSAKRQVDDGTWRNSSVILDRQGEVAGIYNKNHLTIRGSETGTLYGREANLIECDFGKVACAICFDLNFDELRLKYVKARPDLILFSSMYHGGLMQQYWAYSCRCHFVGAVWRLPSEIRNPFGEIVASSTNYRDYAVASVNLDCCLAHLDDNWDKLRALKGKYGAGVGIHDPGHVGAVLISSETDDVSVTEMIKEFEIELLDDYFARSLAHRNSPGRIEEQ